MTQPDFRPWIYRWSRPIIAAIALLGLTLTTYLTIVKVTGKEAFCLGEQSGAGSCNDVFSSPYATVFGLPLTVYGMGAYFIILLLAVLPLAFNLTLQKPQRETVERITGWGLLLGSTAMMVASGYLMYILAFDLQTFCPYCVASASFAVSFFLLSLLGRNWQDLGQLFLGITMVGLVTWVGTLGVFAQDTPTTVAGDRTPIPTLQRPPQPGVGWQITTDSGNAELQLAQHLHNQGAKMYGAYWCPHCHEQKLLLGKQAFQKIDYIECGRGAKNSQRDRCSADGIEAYPTWEINGQRYTGIQSPDKLAKLSNYDGSTNFKYTMPGL
ncbi:vitamin K epoxide reductase family protein [Spirulina sp. CS-785/01]|uniref:vitamin K epoxide reductase family protein n=1 Tax=Spirulina sp. CS-785/01 TaxID=3021716 RepID=UPI00232F0AE3|nr:vitamin K epoxide reductase family protein [Spirulina sp. CS-785/01]MDB9311544.1 vitamin K epoxide reductase family protein [Spirulina sp. CS-785/01]